MYRARLVSTSKGHFLLGVHLLALIILDFEGSFPLSDHYSGSCRQSIRCPSLCLSPEILHLWNPAVFPSTYYPCNISPVSYFRHRRNNNVITLDICSGLSSGGRPPLDTRYFRILAPTAWPDHSVRARVLVTSSPVSGVVSQTVPFPSRSSSIRFVRFIRYFMIHCYTVLCLPRL